MEYLKLRWGVGFIWSAMLIQLTDRVILGSRRLNSIKYKKKVAEKLCCKTYFDYLCISFHGK